MEVHHPHHISHKKNIKEYLLEFIMLFFAVSLGFFAENLREIQIENHRAKEFLELFRNEVSDNNKMIDSIIKEATPLLMSNEKLCYELSSNPSEFSLEKIADTLNMWVYRFSNDKRIFDQMKNSGALRYIKDQRLIDLITAYESEADLAEFRAFDQETSQWKEWWLFINENMPSSFMMKVITHKRLTSLNNLNPDFNMLYENNIGAINKKIKTASIDERTKEKFINFLSHRVSLQKISMANYIRVKSRGKHLVEELELYINNH